MPVHKIGLPRKVDELGRIVIVKGFRELGGIQTGDSVLQSLVTDPDSGRVLGILIEPAAWVADPGSAPYIDVALERLEKRGDGGDR